MLKVNLWVWGSYKERSSFYSTSAEVWRKFLLRCRCKVHPLFGFIFSASRVKSPAHQLILLLLIRQLWTRHLAHFSKTDPFWGWRTNLKLWSLTAAPAGHLLSFYFKHGGVRLLFNEEELPKYFSRFEPKVPSFHSIQKKNPTHVIWMALYQKRWGKCQLYLFSLLYQTFLFPQWMCRLQPLSWHILSSRLY